MSGLGERGARLVGGALASARRVHGGDLSEIVRIALADGREAIVKNGPAPRTEAAMLRAIAAAGAPAPAVLGESDEALVIELLPAGGSLGDAWASLGQAAATLHAAKGSRYGWHADYAFGGVAIANGWSDDWPAFWAERRLMPFVGRLPPDLARRIEALAATLPALLPARPKPSLLHGDLWTGNVLADGGRVAGLIDPACYYGDREVDLAMLGLFGAPGPAFFEAYGALDAGHRERAPVYRLWPALVHLSLFGGGYRSLVEACLTEAGA